MHAAVWSQQPGHAKLGQTRAVTIVPDSLPAKAVLVISLFLSFFGGLLCLTGLTGCFVLGNSKVYLGPAAFAGIVCIFSGVCGSRAVSRWDKAKACTNLFTFFAIICVLFCITVIILGSLVLINKPPHLLAKILAIVEIVIGLATCLLSTGGLVVALVARPVLTCPLGADSGTRSNRNQDSEDQVVGDQRSSTSFHHF